MGFQQRPATRQLGPFRNLLDVILVRAAGWQTHLAGGASVAEPSGLRPPGVGPGKRSRHRTPHQSITVAAITLAVSTSDAISTYSLSP